MLVSKAMPRHSSLSVLDGRVYIDVDVFRVSLIYFSYMLGRSSLPPCPFRGSGIWLGKSMAYYSDALPWRK